MSERGLRYNSGKLQPSLLSPHALKGVMRVMAIGAVKYKPRNWEKGLPLAEIIDSLVRHTWALQGGQFADPETGLPHADHIAWNALALSHFTNLPVNTTTIPALNVFWEDAPCAPSVPPTDDDFVQILATYRKQKELKEQAAKQKECPSVEKEKAVSHSVLSRTPDRAVDLPMSELKAYAKSSV